LSTEYLLIRNCELSDLQYIQRIENASFPDDPYPPTLFRAFYLNSNRIFRVAVLENNIISYSIVKIDFGNEDRTISHLVSLAVDPLLRRRGIGSKMLEDAIHQTKARFQKCKSMILEVRADNIPAINLYVKFGFRKVGVISNYYGRRKDAMVMKLDFC
jgi:ribosomal-protein-alanine N-acetyltransferase